MIKQYVYDALKLKYEAEIKEAETNIINYVTNSVVLLNILILLNQQIY